MKILYFFCIGFLCSLTPFEQEINFYSKNVTMAVRVHDNMDVNGRQVEIFNLLVDGQHSSFNLYFNETNVDMQHPIIFIINRKYFVVLVNNKFEDDRFRSLGSNDKYNVNNTEYNFFYYDDQNRMVGLTNFNKGGVRLAADKIPRKIPIKETNMVCLLIKDCLLLTAICVILYTLFFILLEFYWRPTAA
jgi:hypothetical protein